MSKLLAAAAIGLAVIGMAAGEAAARAAVLGPNAAQCREPGRPAMLVRVVGLKSRAGVVRVQSYGGDPQHFFDKGSWLDRVDVHPPAQGLVEICMPVARPGIYAVSVRHDANGTGGTDLRDGGGMSGNPQLSLFDVMLKRRPDPAKVSVRVGQGVTVVPVTVNYVQGGSIRPVAG